MKIKSRKQVRKEIRKSKKIKKHEFFSRKKPKTKNNGKVKYEKSNVTECSKSFHSNLKNNEKPNHDSNIISNKKLVNKTKKNANRAKAPQERLEYERQKEKMELEKLNRDIKTNKIKMLKSDNLKEDIEIRKLEKQLKINKKLSKAFTLDGLDYILDICDKKNSENKYENTLKDSDSEFENDFENILGKDKKSNSKKSKNNKMKNNFIKDKEILENDSDSKSYSNEDTDDDDYYTGDSKEDDIDFDNEEDNSGNDLDDDNESCLSYSSNSLEPVETMDLKKKEYKKSSENNKKKTQKGNKSADENTKQKTKKIKNKKGKTSEPFIESDVFDETDEVESLEKMECTTEAQNEQVWEDIYGRTRDQQGNIITHYVPPQLRKKIMSENEEKNSEKSVRLKKQIKGLLNRLAESNMHFISNQLEQLYMSNSRNQMNETLFTLFKDSLFMEISIPERLIAEHALLVAVLHSNIGSEIGAHFLQHSIIEFCGKLESNPEVENKEINNILIFIMFLYNFQIFHSKLMYDLIYLLLKQLEEKQIELLLASFRIVGFNLRKDDPVSLKNLVLQVQKQVNGISVPELSSRVKFMLDMLMAIKNNNMSKIPNYDPEFVDRLRKSLKLLIRKGNYNTELNISLEDLLNVEKHGRWWIVGSAWSGGTPGQSDSSKSKEPEISMSNEFSQKLLDLAKQQRMNTDIRKNIFCIIMSAEDFLDAFEKLFKLKLKGVVEREIMNVLFHCALQEKNFNPYYVFLANKFCIFDRKYQIMLQCALWDKIKELQNLLPIQITNLAKFVGNIILEKGLPISVLKVIQFSDLDKPTIKFMRQVLLTIFYHKDQNSVAAVFRRIADSKQLQLFRESLRLFLQHFVLKNSKTLEKEKVNELVEMVKIAEQALTSTDAKMVF